MPITLHCTMCGANVEADDLAVRRELTVCSHCGTVLRITRAGTEEYGRSLQAEPAPEGVTVVRTGAEELSITARRTDAAFVINRREIVQGILAGVGVVAGLTLLGGLLSIPLILFLGKDLIPLVIGGLIFFFVPTAFIAALIAVFVLAVAHQTLPPVRLAGGRLSPATMGSGPIPVKEIRQLYSTATKVVAPRAGDRNFVSYSVYALKEDGRRLPVVGPLASPEIALYIEELLEVEFGILDLPVYGDKKLPVGTIASTPAPAAAANMRCGACGAELPVGEADLRRGFLVCRYCGGVTLLYEPGSAKPILGVPRENEPGSEYLVESESAGTAVYSRTPRMRLLEVGGGKIILRGIGREAREIPISQIAWLQVKASKAGGEKASAGAAIAAGLLKLGNAMAYSGDVDPSKIIQNELLSDRLVLTMKMGDGSEMPLLPVIHNPGEAFFLLDSIRAACGLR